jgi:hypothetical protein
MTEIVKKENAELLLQDAGNFDENLSDNQTVIVRLKLLQALSSQLKRGDPSYIESAREGDLVNTLTNEIFKEIKFVPIKRRVNYIAWDPEDRKSGPKTEYKEDSSAYDKATVIEGKRVTPEGWEIQKNYEVYCLFINEGVYFTGMFTLKANSKNFNQEWNKLNTFSQELKYEGKQLPLFAGYYILSSKQVNYKNYSWAALDIAKGGITTDLDNGTEIYKAAKSFLSSFDNYTVEGEE